MLPAGLAVDARARDQLRARHPGAGWKSTEIAALIPGAKLTVMESAPHGANVERPEEFNGAVLDFMAGHTPRPSSQSKPTTASSTSACTGAARSNSTISSTLDTGPPGGAAMLSR
jgi:hypothetical protein